MDTFATEIAITRKDVFELLAAAEHPISGAGASVLLADRHTQQRCETGRPIEWALIVGIDTRQVRLHLADLASEGQVVAVDQNTARQLTGAGFSDAWPFYVALR